MNDTNFGDTIKVNTSISNPILFTAIANIQLLDSASYLHCVCTDCTTLAGPTGAITGSFI